MKQFLRNYSPSMLSCAGFLLLCAGLPVGVLLFLAGILMAGFSPRYALFAFPDNCTGRLIDVSPTTGCTLSLATVKPWTLVDLEENSLTEIGYDLEYGRLQEARIAGFKESSLSSLITSKVANISNLVQRRPVQGNKSIVFPWIQMMQKRNINIQYWGITSGAANPNAGLGSTHPGAWDLVVANQAGAFATALPNIFHYFLPGKALYVDYASADGVAHSLQYVVLASSAIGAGSTATVTVAPNVSPAGWAALSAADKLIFQIGGLAGGAAAVGAGAFMGPNSVSDWESYKEQEVPVNNSSVLHFAQQTSRSKWEYTDQWRKIMANALMGTFFKKYWQLDEAEQRRQNQAIFEKDLLNAVFFGQRENEFQDPLDETKWRQLPTAVDPANGNCVMEYKTRALGLQSLLTNCGRYFDKAGGTINFSDLFANHYMLMRSREADGGEVLNTDWLTDYETAGQFEREMMRFYPEFYHTQTMLYIKSGEDINPEIHSMIGFKRYPVPIIFGGGNINIFYHNYFADRLRGLGGVGAGVAGGLSGTNPGMNAHRYLMGIDWSDFKFGVSATNMRMTETNEKDELYRYVLKVNKTHVMNQSITWTAILQDPNRHTMYRNFSGITNDITPPST